MRVIHFYCVEKDCSKAILRQKKGSNWQNEDEETQVIKRILVRSSNYILITLDQEFSV